MLIIVIDISASPYVAPVALEMLSYPTVRNPPLTWYFVDFIIIVQPD